MNLYATLALSLALSMDAFAASVCKGASLFNPSLREAIRTGFIFGIIERPSLPSLAGVWYYWPATVYY
ncbi:putative manganese efflux pump MntP [Arsenophonus endosymbiont of Bemisia tabaci Q2]|nr:putative manganese efflux pump MntP [Arsenophonus endosymbiont of Bemisia tabaci Q2]